MNATETWQVVRSPEEDLSDELIAKLEALSEADPIPRSAKVKILLGQFLHRLGIHTWVRHRRWDERSDRMIDVGVVCWYCPTGRRKL